MSMEFNVYQLNYAGNLTLKTAQLFAGIQGLAKIPGEFGFEYCISNELVSEDDIIVGCLSEEHPPLITTVDDDKNTIVPDVAPFARTIFALDFREKFLLVQHRDYSADNLYKQQSLSRLGILLSKVFQEILHVDFDLIPTNRSYTEEEFIQAFNRNRTTLLRVRLYEAGSYIPQNVMVFDDEDLNTGWVNGWNQDTSESREVLLKAKGRGGGGDLRNSPLARSLLALQVKEILELDFWDGDKKVSMSKNNYEKFTVQGIGLHTDVIKTTYEVWKDLRYRRSELREFEAFVPLE